MATLVLGLVGAAIGASGGPAGAWRGFQIGATIGGFVDPAMGGASSASLGKLSDLRYSGSSYGADLPRLWGRGRVGGNVIWMATDAEGNHLIEHQTTQHSGGGKKGGGATYTNYWYSATFAVAFCSTSFVTFEGDAASRPVRLKRLWANDTVIWSADAATNVANLVWYDGSEDQPQDPAIVAHEGAQAPAHRGLAYCVISDLDLSDYGQSIPSISAELTTDDATLGDVASDLARWVGLSTAWLNFAPATAPVAGCLMSSRGAAGAGLQSVATAMGYDLLEVDGQLKALPRGGAATFAIDQDDLGATSTGDPGAKIERSLADEGDLPGRVDVAYFDVDRDFLQTTQSETRQDASLRNSASIQLSMALGADDARRIAAQQLDIAWTEIDRYTFSLPLSYLSLAPGDVVNVPTDDGPVRVRLLQVELAPIGEIRCTAVRDDASVMSQSGVGDPGGGTGGGGGGVVLTPVPTVWTAWSGPELRDADQSQPGFYVAANGPSGWVGGTIYYSTDGGANYVAAGAISGRCTFGQTTTTLAPGTDLQHWDDANSVGLLLDEGALANCADSLVLAGQNRAVLGSEILGVGVATLTGASRYTLSHLLRGVRGSSQTGHFVGERFVLATDAVARIAVDSSLVGQTLTIKVVSRYQNLADAEAKSVVIQPRTPLPIEDGVDRVESELLAHEASLAGTSTVGHVKVGSGLQIASDGTVSVSSNWGAPLASPTVRAPSRPTRRPSIRLCISRPPATRCWRARRTRITPIR